MSRFWRDSLHTMVFRLAGTILGLGTTVLFARILGPEGRGELFLLLFFPGMINVLLNLGLTYPITIGVSQKRWTPAAIAARANRFLLIGAVGYLIAAYPLAWAISTFWFGGKYLILAGALLSIFLFQTAFQWWGAISLALGKIKVRNEAEVVGSVVLLIGLGLIYWFHGGLTEVCLLVLANNLLIPLYVGLRQLRDGLFSLRNPARLAKEDWSLALRGAFGNIMLWLNYRLDTPLVAVLMTMAQVGFYAQATQLAEILLIIPNSLAMVIFAATSAEGNAVADRRTPQVARIALWTVIAGGLIGAAITPWAVPILLTKSFEGAVLPLILLLPGMAGLTLTKIINHDLAGRGQTQYISYSALISLVLMLSLDVLLVPKYNASGASVASSVAYCANGILSLVWMKKYNPTPISQYLLPRMDDVRLLVSRFNIV